MTELQTNRSRELLEAKKAELVQGITRQRERLLIGENGDPMDRVRMLAERELTLRKLDLKFVTEEVVRVVPAAWRSWRGDRNSPAASRTQARGFAASSAA